MQRPISKGFAGVLFLIFVAGCGRPATSSLPVTPVTPSGPDRGAPTSPGPVPRPAPGSPAIPGICSKLNFSGVSWSSNLTSNDRVALELALNISGSYEGSDGWANLTNNFDGQGMSLGLLNQTLGTSSLQPLLVQMRDKNLGILQSIFDSSRLQSLLAMLSQWEGNKGMAAQMGLPDGRLSPLDIPFLTSKESVLSQGQSSVTWATNNLYTDGGTTFDPVWAKDLRAMASHPAYVSLQISAAETLHALAVSELAKSKVTELRGYLMMFDVNVQNGGLYAQDWTDYSSWLANNSGASFASRLDEILTLRLRHVLTQYVDDVRRRKQTIIDGTGTVHGDQRNLETEYCFNRLAGYP